MSMKVLVMSQRLLVICSVTLRNNNGIVAFLFTSRGIIAIGSVSKWILPLKMFLYGITAICIYEIIHLQQNSSGKYRKTIFNSTPDVFVSCSRLIHGNLRGSIIHVPRSCIPFKSSFRRIREEVYRSPGILVYSRLYLPCKRDMRVFNI